jgi:hypothetical protein
MPDKGNALSRNPNICASCSSMADGMEETIASGGSSAAPNKELARETADATALGRVEGNATEPAIHHVPL